MKICIFGASSAALAQVYYDAAFELGAKLAERGHELIFGGGRSGLMGAAARGVTSKGGRMIGIAPGFFDEPGILYRGCTEIILTESMRDRKKVMEDMSDAFAVLPGGIGTFEEFFETLTLKQLGRHAKGIAMLDVNGYYSRFDEMMRFSVEEKFTPADGYALYETFTDCGALLDYLENYKSEPQDVWKDKIFGKYPTEGE